MFFKTRDLAVFSIQPLFNLYLKSIKTGRIHIAGHLHKNTATQNIINE